MALKVIAQKRYRLGIDVGGTFTDVQILDQHQGGIKEYKTSTTPQDPAIGILDGILGAARRYGFSIADIDLIVHGTTIATNAVLEDKMAPVALITTSGFEDILEIARHSRKDIYGLYAEERRLLVPRQRRYGVVERVTAAGKIETPLDEKQLREVVRKIERQDIKTVAVCLLNSYANDVHERVVADLIESEFPHIAVSISSTLSPEIREYERTSTTVLNAALTPVVAHYMEKLRARLAETGIDAQVLILQSNGGAILPEHAAREPARLLLSGPCGGTIATEQIARTTDEPNLIAVDMGGTSFDVSVVRNGRTTRVAEGNVDGCPVRLPMAEIVTIGAGGGSIAWLDQAGRLRVGPQSAGAVPGPACYRRGGTLPTVTDADIALGRLDGGAFMGGSMKLDRQASVDAIRIHIAEPLKLSMEEAAEGIISIAAAHMANAIRLSLFERGLDPEDFALVSFGGAGGLHATSVAEEAGVRRVIFPRGASTLSAYGMLWTDVLHDFARTKIVPADDNAIPALSAIVADMKADADRSLAQDGLPPDRRQFEAALDLRYKGQGYELTLPLRRPALDAAVLATAVADFHDAHEARFSHSDKTAAVEIVTARMTSRGRLEKARDDAYPALESGPPHDREILLGGTWHTVPVFKRGGIPAGGAAGPLLVEEEYTTILVPAGWTMTVLQDGGLSARHMDA